MLEDILKKKESLHEDLIPYLEQTSLGIWLKHPLVFSVFHSEQLNAFCNEQYRIKKEKTEELLKEQDFSSYIWYHERLYRLPKFLEIGNLIKDQKEFWHLFSSIWIDCENLWQHKKTIKSILQKANRHLMMNEEEQEIYASLPDVVKVFRGHQKKNRMGYSWSLSHFKAEWFSKRHQENEGLVTEGFIKKKDIAAILMGRGEFEVVCNPYKVKKNYFEEIKREEWMQSILDQALKEFALSKNSYHGIKHWKKVERNALEIAKLTENCDETVVQLFGILHDSKRTNEFEDSNHGLNASKFAKLLHSQGKLLINEKQLEKLSEACEFHDKGGISNDPTIGACWDADRLELTRVGITPDPKFFSTKAGLDLMWKI